MIPCFVFGHKRKKEMLCISFLLFSLLPLDVRVVRLRSTIKDFCTKYVRTAAGEALELSISIRIKADHGAAMVICRGERIRKCRPYILLLR